MRLFVHVSIVRLCIRAPLLAATMMILPTRAAETPPPPYDIGHAVNDAVAPPRPPRPEVSPAPEVREAGAAPVEQAGEQRLLVHDFRVDGAEFLDAREIAAELAPFRERRSSLEQIRQAANRLTVLCRRKGYLVARAYVPKQQVEQGIVHLQILPGRYGRVTLENRSRVSDSRLQHILAHSTAGSAVITRGPLEQAMLKMGDLPGMRLPAVTLSAGQAPGTTDVLVSAPRNPLLSGYLVTDAYGNRFTGKYRTSAGVEVDSPFGWADRLSLSAMRTEAAGLQNYRAAYDIPLGNSGLRGEVAASRTTYQLGAEYEALQANGTANAVEATLSYPLLRRRSSSLSVSLSYAGKRLKDEIDLTSSGNAKRSRALTLSLASELHGQLAGHAADCRVEGGGAVGRLQIDDPRLRAQNQAGIDTVGHWSKVFASVSAQMALDDHWAMSGTLRGQRAINRSLDGSEQFNVSGPGGLHSYPDGAVDDSGYLIGVELQRQLWSRTGRRQVLGLSANYGAVQPRDRRFSVTGPVTVSEIGGSYSLFGKHVFARAEFVRATGTDAVTRRYNGGWRTTGQLGVRF